MSSSTTTLTGSTGREVGINKVPIWRRRKAAANYMALLPYVFFALFPFYIMGVTSIKTDEEINNLGNSPFWARTCSN